MNTSARLNLIAQDDRKLQTIGLISNWEVNSDPLHFQRRQQQRGVNEAMVRIAIAYGKKEYIYDAISFTLIDKKLRHTPYQKFIDALRGLRVICHPQGLPNPLVKTVYWHYKTKNSVRI